MIRFYSDIVPGTSGQQSGGFGQRSGPIRTRFRRFSDSSRHAELARAGGIVE